MAGIAVEPWCPGEIYAVATAWSQASSPVMVYYRDHWELEEHGQQVANSRHEPRAALESVLREVIEGNGDELSDAEIDKILDGAVDLQEFQSKAENDD
jgi:hypothetical protein